VKLTRKELKFSLLVILALVFTSGILAQAPSKFQPTEIQSLRLQVKQRDAIIARQNYENAVNQIQAEAEKVRKENNWPDTVRFDFNSLTFFDTATPPKTQEPKKP